jgi:hypothetical protein
MKISQRQLWLAAALLLIVTNVVALGGVAFNRAGGFDSDLTLSERELTGSYPRGGWSTGTEDSGLDLHLNWSVRTASGGPGGGMSTRGWPGNGGVPWLDAQKLRALGIGVDVGEHSPEARRRIERSSGRDVYLVLEMDGPAYATSLADARAEVDAAQTAVLAHPADSAAQRSLTTARARLAQDEESATRLFLVDAGLDAATLRRQYPARTQYAIVRGHVRALVTDVGGRPVVSGFVSDIYCSTINVPVEFRSAFGSPNGRFASPKRASAVRIEVKFGRRFEPWIEAVAVPVPAAIERAATPNSTG